MPRQAGVTLVEVLITLVIISVGLLGIATLQYVSKRANFESVQRVTATMLANEILERMRANPNTNALATYAGTAETASLALDGTVYGTEPTPNCSAATPCLPVGTSTATLAIHDRWEFERMLVGATETAKSGTINTGGLVTPTLCITTDVPGANINRSGIYRVTLAWRGQQKLKTSASAALNTCGTGNYDETGGDNAYRRLLVVEHYITQQIIE